MEFRDVAPEHKVWALSVKDLMKKLQALAKLQFPMGLAWTGTGSGPAQPAQAGGSEPPAAAAAAASEPTAAAATLEPSTEAAAPEPTAATQSVADAGPDASVPGAGM